MANIIVANVVIHHVQDVVKNERQFQERIYSRSGNVQRALRIVCNVQAALGSSHSKCDLFWSAPNLIEGHFCNRKYVCIASYCNVQAVIGSSHSGCGYALDVNIHINNTNVCTAWSSNPHQTKQY